MEPERRRTPDRRSTPDRRKVSIDSVRAWHRIARDLILTGLGAFLIIYPALVIRDISILTACFALAATLFGLPPYLRRNLDDQDSTGHRKDGPT